MDGLSAETDVGCEPQSPLHFQKEDVLQEVNRTVSPVMTQITEFLVWVLFIDILDDVLHH